MALPSIAEITAALLGRSAYQAPPPSTDLTLDSEPVVRMRRRQGGNLQPPPYSFSRWYMADLESAEQSADGGQIEFAARLMRAARRDGVLAGVLSTRTDGLVRLPKRFRGDKEVIEALELGHDSACSVFDEIFPARELALLAADGELLGIGVGELVPVQGRDYPVFVRLDPEFLFYRWYDNAWYFKSTAGPIRIVPGDGRWILHTPGGRQTPWQNALWKAIGQAWIRKTHAQAHKDNWEGKLANPARVATAPPGAAENQRDNFLSQVMAWGVNTVFSLPIGWGVSLIESNGRGWECFAKTIEACNDEFVLALAGQKVTTDGGAGFQNSDLFKSIRADLIKATADGLAYTINTQGIPVFVAARYGLESVTSKPCVFEWDVTPPKDRNSEASSMLTAANAILQLTTALSAYGQQVDVAALCTQFGIPIEGDADGDGQSDAKPAQLTLIQGGLTQTPNTTPAVKPDVAKPAAANATPASASAPTGAGQAAADSGGDQAQDSALNGAQVTSLVEIVVQVAAGQLPRDAALAIVKRAYLVDDAEAEEILGSAGNGFVIKPAAAPPTPTKPAAPAPPVAA